MYIRVVSGSRCACKHGCVVLHGTSIPARTDEFWLGSGAVVSEESVRHQLSAPLFTYVASKPWEERRVVDLVFQRLRTQHATRQPYLYLGCRPLSPLAHTRSIEQWLRPGETSSVGCVAPTLPVNRSCVSRLSEPTPIAPFIFHVGVNVVTARRSLQFTAAGRLRKLVMQTAPPLAKPIRP